MDRIEDARSRIKHEASEEFAREIARHAQDMRVAMQTQIDEKELIIEDLRTNSMPMMAVKVLVVMAALTTMTLIVANLCAMKIWDFLGIPVDGGIVLFPIIYITGDLLCEIYGKKTADQVAFLAYAIGVSTMIVLRLVGFLPDYYLADNQTYASLVPDASTVMLASLTSFLAGRCVNNGIFDEIRQEHGAITEYQKRSVTSSFFAHLVDAAFFETFAFIGRLPFWTFVNQLFFAFVAGLWLELQLWPLNDWLNWKLVSKLHYYNGKTYIVSQPPPSD